MSIVSELFKECVSAIGNGVLIEREGQRDKEFHFQNWFKARLDAMGEPYDEPGRNTYPDFRCVRHAEGYEIKGLAYPGRQASYDSNSQVPCGEHNGRQIFHVFGRYPDKPDGNRYPVLDLVICHGSFLNADNSYVHENKSFRNFGSYGDILIRDRKMYVAPTPLALAEGTAHNRTLIIPAHMKAGKGLFEISTLVRREAERIVVAYTFDLRSNELHTDLLTNPNAGREHVFKAYRMDGDPDTPVSMAQQSGNSIEERGSAQDSED